LNSSLDLSEKVAAALLEVAAIALRPNQPFTWSSGLKSPIYCDCRLTISYPELREMIADGFAALIKELFPQTEVIAGAATGGIPHAAWVAQKLNLPMVYVRDKPKGHGKENSIEGVLKPRQKVVVIEDLISTGGSSIKVAVAVKDAGADVLSVMAITTYQLAKAEEAFAQSHIPLHTLTNFTTVLNTAVKLGKIKPDDIALMQSWRADPQHFI